MGSWLQFLSAVASLFSVPLALYFYLKSQDSQLRRLREDIARSISYQIGDGRTLSLFEVQSVIDSQSRQARIAKGKIRSDEIVEDLVTDTIRNPMITSERKELIIDNLRRLHASSTDENEASPLALFESASPAHLSLFFRRALIVLAIGFIAGVYFFFPNLWRESFSWSLTKNIAFGGLASIVISLIAFALTLAYRRFASR